MVFRIDGLGATLTTILLLGVLSNHQEQFGMPKQILTMLGIIAAAFGLYSFIGSTFPNTRAANLLKVIIVANVLYCGLTAGLVTFYFNQITLLGKLYFIAEIIIISFLVSIEIQTIKKFP